MISFVNLILRICIIEMSAVLTRCRVSSEQLDLLLSFMEEHPDFAAGKQSIYSRFSSSKLWRLLAERLNAAAADSGGARKSPDKWCRVSAHCIYLFIFEQRVNWCIYISVENHFSICTHFFNKDILLEVNSNKLAYHVHVRCMFVKCSLKDKLRMLVWMC